MLKDSKKEKKPREERKFPFDMSNDRISNCSRGEKIKNIVFWNPIRFDRAGIMQTLATP
jgi:hypothetical protein